MSGVLQGLAAFLQNVGQTDQAYRQNQHMGKVFAANPQFGQQLYGAQNDQRQTSLLEQVQREKQLKAQALAQYAQSLGSNVDPQNALLEYAKVSGDPEMYLKSLTGENTPSAVKEYEYVSKLPPQEQLRYLSTKRANQVINLGDTQAIVDPTGGIKQQYDVNLKPEDLPENAKNKARATAEGDVEGSGAITDVDKKATAKGDLSTIIDELKVSYSDLDRAGGITSTDRGWLSNIGASLGSSAAGQFGGKIIGSDDQKIREDIKSKIPLLMSAIKSATGKSASEINSIPEMQLLKSSVSDLTQPIQTVVKTLNDLDRLYGSKAPGVSPDASGAPTEGKIQVNKKTGARRIFKGGAWQPL